MSVSFPGPLVHVVWKHGDRPCQTHYLFEHDRGSTDMPDVVHIHDTGYGVSMRGSLVVVGRDLHGLPAQVFNAFRTPVYLRVDGETLRIVIVPRENDNQTWIDTFNQAAACDRTPAPAEA